MHVLARVGGVPVLGLLIDIGALVSLFAGTLACITAAARVLLLMAHDGLAHGSLRTTHAQNETPSRAVIVTGVAALLPVAVLARAEPAAWTFMAGWVRSPLTVLSWLMRWFASRCRVTCATMALSVPELSSFPGWPALQCCWRSPAISIRCQKDLTASSHTFISLT